MIDEKLLVKYFKAHLSKRIQIESRIDALTAVVGLLAGKLGMTPEEVNRLLQNIEAQAHQKRLEIAEDIDPEIAAELDKRPPHGPIPPTP